MSHIRCEAPRGALCPGCREASELYDKVERKVEARSRALVFGQGGGDSAGRGRGRGKRARKLQESRTRVAEFGRSPT
jgi:hypothetical protein